MAHQGLCRGGWRGRGRGEGEMGEAGREGGGVRNVGRERTIMNYNHANRTRNPARSRGGRGNKETAGHLRKDRRDSLAAKSRQEP